jgi:hypothetical protein
MHYSLYPGTGNVTVTLLSYHVTVTMLLGSSAHQAVVSIKPITRWPTDHVTRQPDVEQMTQSGEAPTLVSSGGRTSQLLKRKTSQFILHPLVRPSARLSSPILVPTVLSSADSTNQASDELSTLRSSQVEQHLLPPSVESASEPTELAQTAERVAVGPSSAQTGHMVPLDEATHEVKMHAVQVSALNFFTRFVCTMSSYFDYCCVFLAGHR